MKGLGSAVDSGRGAMGWLLPWYLPNLCVLTVLCNVVQLERECTCIS